MQIIKSQAEIDEQLAKIIAGIITSSAKYNLKKQPSVAEGIDWANFLKQYDCDNKLMKASIGMLFKNEDDMQKMRAVLDTEFTK